MDYRDRIRRHRPEIGRFDPWMLIATLMLAGFGIVMVYSASFVRAEAAAISNHDALFFFKRQLVWVVAGTILMLLMTLVDYRKLNSKVTVGVLFSLVVIALLLVFIKPIGLTVNGASRWIYLKGMRFQPAEAAKLVTVIMLAYIATRKREKISQLKDGVLPMIVGPVIFVLLINFQPDLGSCVVIMGILIIMLFVAGTRWIYLWSSGLFLLLGFSAAIIHKPYRIQRIVSYLNPWAEPEGKGYQIIQSLIAFGSGGFFGRGLGQGRQKLFYLPEPHNDFILATVGEEVGIIGLWLLLALFAFLIFRAYKTTFSAPDRFGLLLGFGLSSLLTLQVVINAMVVLGLLPNKGLALPFISYGGSSALLNFATVGLLLALSRHSDGPVRQTFESSGEALVTGEVMR